MHYPSLQANSASTSHHQGGGGSGPSGGGPSTGGVGSGMKNQSGNNAGGGQGQQQHPQVVKELLDRVHEEFNHLQQQLQHSRLELEKGQQERDSMQRYAMMYNETLFSLNMELQKHMEIAKRLSGILTHVIPMLPQEHQGSAVAAVERAKTINPQELQNLFSTHMQQQQLAAMMQAVGPAAAAAFNPAMMMAGMGLNMNIKPEEAMQAVFNNFLKNPMMAGASGGLPPPSGIPPGAAINAGGMPLMPSHGLISSVGGDETGRPSTQPGRASSVLNNSAADSNSRPRSGSPSGTGTPNSLGGAASKRAKLEPEEGDGELEIDVQNDDATSSAAPSHHTNGRTSQSMKSGGRVHGHGGKDMERDTASASSSRDSATPRSGKQQLSSTPGSLTGAAPNTASAPPLLPAADPNLANFFTAAFNTQIPGLFGLGPRPGGGPIPQMAGGIHPQLGAFSATTTTNGKSPTYAFKVIPGESITPVSFPSDASTGSDIPKGLKRIGDLPHGEVVCAVTIAKDGQRVFTGGKGTVKVWNIGERIGGGYPNNSTSPSGGDSGTNTAADGDGMGIANNGNGGGLRVSSTEPWIPMKIYPCLTEKDSLKDCYIRSCKLFPDCSTLIVGGETKTICVLDVERGETKMELDCEAEACYALALSPDSRLCFSCCSSGVVVVWDLQSGERVCQLEGHSDGASCVDLSADGQRLWTGGLDSTVRCWDIGERTQMDKMTLDSQIFSLGCCPTDDWVAVGMEDQNVQVLNTNRSGEKFLLQNHQSCVLSLKFAHSGKWFVSTGKDNVVNCWRTPYGYRLLRSKEASSVLSCDISADDRFLLTGSGDKKASLYELTFDKI